MGRTLGTSSAQYVKFSRAFIIVVCLYIKSLHFKSVLEVYQFARDAAVAEGWLMAQESYLTSHELGVSVCSNKKICRVNYLFTYLKIRFYWIFSAND